MKFGCYKSPLRYENVEGFTDEVIKSGSKMNFYFRITEKGIKFAQEDEEYFESNNFCRFCEKNIEPDKVRDHCL